MPIATSTAFGNRISECVEMELIHQVGVDPARGGRGGVSQGLSNINKGGSRGGGHGGEGVAQSVKGQRRQLRMGADKPGKVHGQAVGGKGLAHTVHSHQSTVGPVTAQN